MIAHIARITRRSVLRVGFEARAGAGGPRSPRRRLGSGIGSRPMPIFAPAGGCTLGGGRPSPAGGGAVVCLSEWAMSDLDALLAGIVADRQNGLRWLILADWLDDYEQPDRTELLRLHRMLIDTCCEPDAHPERAEWQARVVRCSTRGGAVRSASDARPARRGKAGDGVRAAGFVLDGRDGRRRRAAGSPGDADNVSAHAGVALRLPSEAEWEDFCRAGRRRISTGGTCQTRGG